MSVTAVVPVRDRPDVLDEAVQSMVAAERAPQRIIVVDDGSEIPVDSRRMAGLGPVDVVRHPEARGACAARNTGVAEATTQFVAFNDSDDLWSPWHLSNAVRALQDGVDVYASRMWVDDGRLAPAWPSELDLAKPHRLRGRRLVRLLAHGNLVSTQTLVARRSWLQRVPFDPSLHRFQDWDLGLRLAIAGATFHLSPEPTVEQRVTVGSLTSNYGAGIEARRALHALLVDVDRHAARVMRRSLTMRMVARRFRSAGVATRARRRGSSRRAETSRSI